MLAGSMERADDNYEHSAAQSDVADGRHGAQHRTMYNVGLGPDFDLSSDPNGPGSMSWSCCGKFSEQCKVHLSCTHYSKLTNGYDRTQPLCRARRLADSRYITTKLHCTLAACCDGYII
jgi:hypothetical protein